MATHKSPAAAEAAARKTVQRMTQLGVPNATAHEDYDTPEETGTVTVSTQPISRGRPSR